MKLLSGILLLLFLIACGAEIDSELEQMVPPPPPPPLPGSPIETGSAGFFGKAVPTWAPWASDNKGGVLSPLTNLEEFDKNSQLALTLSDYDFIYSTGYASDTDYILNTPGALDPFRVWLVYNFNDKTGTLTTGGKFLQVLRSDSLQATIPTAKFNSLGNKLGYNSVIFYGCKLLGTTRTASSGGIGEYLTKYDCNSATGAPIEVAWQADEVNDGRDIDGDGQETNVIAGSLRTTSTVQGRWMIQDVKVQPPMTVDESIVPLPNSPAPPTLSSTSWGPTPTWAILPSAVDATKDLTIKLTGVPFSYLWTTAIYPDVKYLLSTATPSYEQTWKTTQLQEQGVPLELGMLETTGAGDLQAIIPSGTFDASSNENKVAFFGCNYAGLRLAGRTGGQAQFIADFVCSGGSEAQQTSVRFNYDLLDGEDNDGDQTEGNIIGVPIQEGFAGLWQPAQFEVMPPETTLVVSPPEPTLPGAETFPILTGLLAGQKCTGAVTGFLTDTSMTLCPTYTQTSTSTTHISNLYVASLCKLGDTSVDRISTCYKDIQQAMSLCKHSDTTAASFTEVIAGTETCPSGYTQLTGTVYAPSCTSTNKVSLCVKQP